jgi:hypothetical protein
MSGEVKYDKGHHAGATPEARIANRLRNSGDTKNADHVVQTGHSPTRVFHNVHHTRNTDYGKPDDSGRDVDGDERGVV